MQKATAHAEIIATATGVMLSMVNPSKSPGATLDESVQATPEHDEKGAASAGGTVSVQTATIVMS